MYIYIYIHLVVLVIVNSLHLHIKVVIHALKCNPADASSWAISSASRTPVTSLAGCSHGRTCPLQTCICLRQTYICPPLSVWRSVGCSARLSTSSIHSWAPSNCCCTACTPSGTHRRRSHMFVILPVVWHTAWSIRKHYNIGIRTHMNGKHN